MSKPCEGIALKPLKPSEFSVPIVLPNNRYIVPSARPVLQNVPLTASEIASEKLFPSLSPKNSTTTSWPQIQARLKGEVEPLNFKKNVIMGIEREQKSLEENARREQITDPCEMTVDQLETNGWVSLSLKLKKDWVEGFLERNTDAPNNPIVMTDWESMTLTPEIANDPVKMQFYVECTNMDGSPVEKEQLDIDYFARDSEKINYNPARLQRAIDRMWAFVGKR